MSFKPASGDGTALEWIKSSYSGADTPSCVEVATTPEAIHVRDSKNPHGPRLALNPTTWAAFLPYTSGH
ncbi:DUF397 domain-containing protein [Streptomyces triticisoli]|jgi:hypothetical protein|uniref:DUF397 domain-containing protein n=1 Tax=Streptomyces triticisoli TaxID=2182797 RepID=UPI000DD8889A|nr:DUF397 domain-containing protein [Streptomyces triticisoli]